MNVALPEIDGRVLTRAVAFKSRATLRSAHREPHRGLRAARRSGAVRRRARRRLGAARATARGRAPDRARARQLPQRATAGIANGVGLDTPASAVRLLAGAARRRLSDRRRAGRRPGLVEALLGGRHQRARRPRRTAGSGRACRSRTICASSTNCLMKFEKTITRALGRCRPPIRMSSDGAFALARAAARQRRGRHPAGARLQHRPEPPATTIPTCRRRTAISPSMPGCAQSFGAHAVIHIGKHGNLEWLPGKALALSEDCFPEAALGPLPHLYPFIVNDPGEGSQAKRRAAAVIVDHLTPPLTRAETYGPLAELERLVDEYYEAAGVDPRRTAWLRGEILALSGRLGLDRDLGIAQRRRRRQRARQARQPSVRAQGAADPRRPARVRQGARGRPADRPAGGAGAGAARRRARRRCLAAARARGRSRPRRLRSARLRDWRSPGRARGPRSCRRSTRQPWRSARRHASSAWSCWRARWSAGAVRRRPDWPATRAVLDAIADDAAPGGAGERPGRDPGRAAGARRPLRRARAVAARRPAAAPTCCRPGAISTRSTAAPCRRRPPGISAGARPALLVERYVQEQGDWPRAVGALRLGHRQHAHRRRRHRAGAGADRRAAGLGCAPRTGSPASRSCRRIVLDRPRVDVTLRVSGFFRDAFPAQIELFDQAVRAVAALDEPAEVNPIAARVRAGRGGAAARRAPPPRRRAGAPAIACSAPSPAPMAPACRR